MLSFNALSLMSGLLAVHGTGSAIGRASFAAATAGLCGLLFAILRLPRFDVRCDGSHYHGPGVPLLPCLGTYVNWYLVAQLEVAGICLLLMYLGLASAFYLAYGVRHSLGRRKWRGWKEYEAEGGGGNLYF